MTTTNVDEDTEKRYHSSLLVGMLVGMQGAATLENKSVDFFKNPVNHHRIQKL